ncbi:MAG: hypothetical protein H6Q33_3878 [Deltaproteobacteria bacterium]|nr:hypothetical protein [Deltaproteobacteria bacterium]
MGISLSRMDKVFITHIHGDHMSDLISMLRGDSCAALCRA